MTVELEKVDLLRQRLGITYREAVDLLQKSRGNVVEALALGEESMAEEDGELEETDPSGGLSSQLREQGGKVLAGLRTVWEQTSRSHLRLKKNGQEVASVPSPVGAVAVLAMAASTPLAILGGLGAVAGMLNNYSLELDRPGNSPDYD